MGLVDQSREFRETDAVEVTLVPGISHGFLQFPSIFPEGWKYIHRCSEWMVETFEHRDYGDDMFSGPATPATTTAPSQVRSARPDLAARKRSQVWDGRRLSHFRSRTDSSGEEDFPLEMTLLSQANVTKGSSSGGSNRSLHAAGRVSKGRGAMHSSGSLSARRSKRRKSLVSLASEDDLLGRRMKGLAGGLMGNDLELDPPPTP
jgi:hypothetical protein